MKGKAIAAALAALTVFGMAPVVSARHQAEEYAERVQRERRERLREAENESRLRAQAESRRRAAEERRIAEENRRINENVILGDDDDEDDESIHGENIEGEEGTEADSSEKKELPNAEARHDSAASLQAEGQEHASSVLPKAEEPEHDVEEAPAESKENNIVGEKMRTPDETTGNAQEVTDTGEGLLARYLRIAREHLQGGKPTQASAQTASVPNGLHIAEPQTMKRLPVEIVDTDGTLIFSDSPEYVSEPGILYSDVVNGDARVFYYHLNDTKKPYKVAVVLEGVSERSAVVSVTRRAIATPGKDYCEVGKSLQQAYFADVGEPQKIVVAPHERRLLLEAADKTALRPGELVSGMTDFTASAPVRVSILFYPPDKNPLRYISEAPILPADEHRLRGTFIGMNRTVRLQSPYHPKKDGVGCVVLADGELDPYREGVDATDGSIVTNSGNYGVVYRLEMPVKKKTRFLMSPMGGVYAGVVRDGAQLIAVPKDRLLFGENSVHPLFDLNGATTLLPSVELADLGVRKQKPQPFFEFSPPGASNLPILLILAPEKTKLAGDGEKKLS